MTHYQQDNTLLFCGIDVGSTTTKAVVLDANNEVLFECYRRHGARQAESVSELLREMQSVLEGRRVYLAFCGSGSKLLAERTQSFFVQEVVAGALSVRTLHPRAKTIIELGGQDAKIVFFKKQAAEGSLAIDDMRMNGSCAGGTGAFLDEIAKVLHTPIEQFNDLAQKGTHSYSISGRCGVYAKTDIQPLLNQGVPVEDLALSSFHAVAKQTIGGLAQGVPIVAPVVFQGGPFTFNSHLIDVFAQRLDLSPDEIVVPKHPETMVALGAAFYAKRQVQTLKAAGKKSIPSDLSVVISQIEGFNPWEFDEGIALTCSKDSSDASEQKSASASSPVACTGCSTTGSGSTSLSSAKASHGRFFENEEEQQRFVARHREKGYGKPVCVNGVIRTYIGIDSGSTTTKIALVSEDGEIFDAYYGNNNGEPLKVATQALIDLRDSYKERGIALEVLGVGSTGYGEMLFQKAYDLDYHVVETVAHASAAEAYVPDVSFVLDIGGQDMKALWIDKGIITDITVNEACSSGCGSFLENFASTLDIPVKDIAKAAFASKDPAVLGSRCTVFMNSRIVSEQRSGKTPDDIMAGLCRSIIENVFTKVVRVANLERLGEHIVVQGGTFRNDAVLRAFEQYVGRQVTRAPYPGLMGAIGVALLTQKHMTKQKRHVSSFIGLDALDSFSYTQRSGETCPFCTNHCNRTIVEFSNGQTWVTGNRCEKGLIVGEPKSGAVKARIKALNKKTSEVANLYKDRADFLFDTSFDAPALLDPQGITIGIPQVLSNWELLPFWRSFFTALGFKVVVSDASTRQMYESGLHAVTSDTLCFPAKLVHGHIRNLVNKTVPEHASQHSAQGFSGKVDRIWMPTITTQPTENKEVTSVSLCAVVKGYSIVMRNSDNPEDLFGVPLDTPLFHWFTHEDRINQLSVYMKDTFSIEPRYTQEAICLAEQTYQTFRRRLTERGAEVLKEVRKQGTYAVVLAGRPYHNDELVNHNLPRLFVERGIPVLTADSLPYLSEVDVHLSRIDVVNNYHARMLQAAVYAAQEEMLEYVQVVSFGCGHDAYLSDEIVRLMAESSNKVPLILKIDESDALGPLTIRVSSFVETVRMRRESLKSKESIFPEVQPLPVYPAFDSLAEEGEEEEVVSRSHAVQKDAYPVKFEKKDHKQKVILVPNTSHAFAQLMSAVFSHQGVIAEPLDIGGEEAIRLGKQYVHNDICFPAQMTIGESLAALKSGKYDDCEVAIGTGKYLGDCRLTHYAALLRKALDDAGYEQVPIITNDDVDAHDIHPGFKMSAYSALICAFALPMIDILEELLRKIRPYELVEGEANKTFERAIDALMLGIRRHGVLGIRHGFKKAIALMKTVAYDRSVLKPRVLIVGEYLLNFHPGANHHIEEYLEANGMEVIEARMTDVLRKTYFYQRAQVKEFKVDRPFKDKAWISTADSFFNIAHQTADRIARSHPLVGPTPRMQDIVVDSDAIIHHSFDAGEGVLIPAEIIHHAKEGCKSFVILQPFGCLPNHVVGRGIVKKLKELYPDVQILPLDYDPDVSFANIENRLQMLIMNAR